MTNDPDRNSKAIEAAILLGIDVESDDPHLAPLVQSFTSEQVAWVASWLSGEGVTHHGPGRAARSEDDGVRRDSEGVPMSDERRAIEALTLRSRLPFSQAQHLDQGNGRATVLVMASLSLLESAAAEGDWAAHAYLHRVAFDGGEPVEADYAVIDTSREVAFVQYSTQVTT